MYKNQVLFEVHALGSTYILNSMVHIRIYFMDREQSHYGCYRSKSWPWKNDEHQSDCWLYKYYLLQCSPGSGCGGQLFGVHVVLYGVSRTSRVLSWSTGHCHSVSIPATTVRSDIIELPSLRVTIQGFSCSLLPFRQAVRREFTTSRSRISSPSAHRTAWPNYFSRCHNRIEGCSSTSTLGETDTVRAMMMKGVSQIVVVENRCLWLNCPGMWKNRPFQRNAVHGNGCYIFQDNSWEHHLFWCCHL